MRVMSQKLKSELALGFLYRLCGKAALVHRVINGDFLIFAADKLCKHSNIFEVCAIGNNARFGICDSVTLRVADGAARNSAGEVFLAHTKSSNLNRGSLLLDNLGTRRLAVSAVKLNVADGYSSGKLAAATSRSQETLGVLAVVEENNRLVNLDTLDLLFSEISNHCVTS